MVKYCIELLKHKKLLPQNKWKKKAGLVNSFFWEKIICYFDNKESK